MHDQWINELLLFQQHLESGMLGPFPDGFEDCKVSLRRTRFTHQVKWLCSGCFRHKTPVFIENQVSTSMTCVNFTRLEVNMRAKQIPFVEIPDQLEMVVGMVGINKEISGGSTDPPRIKMNLISCSFWENLANLYVGTPRGLAPPPTGNPGSAPGNADVEVTSRVVNVTLSGFQWFDH